MPTRSGSMARFAGEVSCGVRCVSHPCRSQTASARAAGQGAGEGSVMSQRRRARFAGEVGQARPVSSTLRCWLRGSVQLLPNHELHPTSLPSEAYFNLKRRLVGSAAGELGCWTAGREWNTSWRPCRIGESSSQIWSSPVELASGRSSASFSAKVLGALACSIQQGARSGP